MLKSLASCVLSLSVATSAVAEGELSWVRDTQGMSHYAVSESLHGKSVEWLEKASDSQTTSAC